MAASAKVRAIPRTRRGVGSRVVIDDEELYKQYERRTGKRPQIDGRDFFYAATVELGDEDREADRSLTSSLYDNKGHIRQEFVDALRRAVAEERAK